MPPWRNRQTHTAQIRDGASSTLAGGTAPHPHPLSLRGRGENEEAAGRRGVMGGAQVSDTCERKLVQVQVLSPAPRLTYANRQSGQLERLVRAGSTPAV